SIFGPTNQAYQYGEGPYTVEGNRQTYEKLLDTGRCLLDQDGGVILDATFRNATDRKRASDLAARAGAQFRLVQCKLAPDLVRSRLERRATCKESLSDATWATYLRQCGEFDPMDDFTAGPHLTLDTARALVVTSHTATDWLRANDT